MKSAAEQEAEQKAKEKARIDEAEDRQDRMKSPRLPEVGEKPKTD